MIIPDSYQLLFFLYFFLLADKSFSKNYLHFNVGMWRGKLSEYNLFYSNFLRTFRLEDINEYRYIYI
jgi:hypothetical protein